MIPSIYSVLTAFDFILILSIFFIFIIVGKYQIDPLTPGVLLAMAMLYFFFTPSLYLLLTDQYLYSHAGPIVSLTIVLLLISVSSGIFYIVYSRDYPLITTKVRDLIPDQNIVSPHHLLLAGLSFTLVGFIGYLAYTGLNGGIVRMLTVEPRLAYEVTPNTTRYRILSWTGIFTGFVLSVTGLLGIDNRTKKDYTLALSVILISTLILLSFRARFVIGFVFGYLALIIHYNIYRIRLQNAVGLFIIGSLFAVALPLVEQVINGGSLTTVFEELVYRYRLEPLMIVVANVPEQVDYKLGRTFTTVFWFDWLLKSQIVGDIVEEMAMGEDRSHYSLSPTAIGEIYLNFGEMGVLLASAGYGALLKILYDIHRYSNSYLVAGMYPAILYPLLVMLPGSIAWGFRTFVWSLWTPLLATVLLIMLINKK